MRILQIIQKPQLRGAEIFACQLSCEFQNRGLHVDVVHLFPHTHFALEFDLNFIDLQANPMKRFWDIKAYKQLNKIVQKGRYDIVQANAADTLKYAVMSKLLFRWKAKLLFRNASLIGRLMYSTSQRIYNRWLLGRCDSIISISENCRQDLIHFSPHARNSTVVIPAGTYSFDSIERAKRSETEQGPVFLHIGSFVWEKNHAFLIEIFNRYFQQYGKGYLWLVGDGKLKMLMEAKVKQMALEERIIFWGSRNDAISILKSADVLLMPSVVEGVPGVILEALSCGVPVLASNAGGIPEVIKHNVNGFCLSELIEDHYVNCMDTLITDKALRMKFIQAGKQLVNDTLNMSLIADQFLAFYGKVITGGK